MQINQFLEDSALKYPDKNAAWFKGQWKTFSELNRSANKLANYLKECGIERGDRVAILMENSFDYIISYYAILKIGAITVALNTETTTESLIYLLNDSEAIAIISQKKFSHYLVPALAKVPYLREVITDQEDLTSFQEIGHCNQIKLTEIYRTGNEQNSDVRCIDIDIASIVYTSGSTGKSKGVVLDHLNIVSNTRSIVEYLRLTADDRVMVVLPFYYIYGKSLINTHYFVGGSVVLDNRFAYPNVILDTMNQTEVTGFAGVPSTFMILLHRSSIKDYKFSTLRYITQAGGAMAPAIQKEVAEVFAPAKLFIMYGATEASARLSYLDPNVLSYKWGSIGKAIPNVDLAIVDDSGKNLGPNSEGHIVARGSNIMRGYWKDSEETKKVLCNGWYYTGDIGRTDEQGFFYVVGRDKDMIKVGGERVSAREIEETILELKEVQEVAAIGVVDDYLGEAIKVFIVLSPNHSCDSKNILIHCRKKLPAYKNPKFIEFVNSLPKNQSGKILKHQLKNM
jgi:long-chain acyl-CoA synthetase